MPSNQPLSPVSGSLIVWHSRYHKGDCGEKTLVLCLAKSSLLQNFTACLATIALSSSFSSSSSSASPLPSLSLPSRMAYCENTRIISTLEPPVYTLAKSNSWPLLEQTRWLGSGLSFSFLSSSFPVSFFFSLGEPAEPQGRRRELLHSEVSRRGKAYGWVLTVGLTICHLQLSLGFHMTCEPFSSTFCGEGQIMWSITYITLTYT